MPINPIGIISWWHPSKLSVLISLPKIPCWIIICIWMKIIPIHRKSIIIFLERPNLDKTHAKRCWNGKNETGYNKTRWRQHEHNKPRVLGGRRRHTQTVAVDPDKEDNKR